MERLLTTFCNYYNRKDFLKFQNDLAKEIYDSLGKSYSNSAGEVKIVTDICNVINGKNFNQFNMLANKIHGKRSYVEFDNKDKPTTKELADMVIISIATRKRKIIFEKIAFIQNKKEKDNIWNIDHDQLYLLQNFPTLKGKTGLLKGFYGTNDVIFSNQSETLGNYGLLQSPGEMILVNALNVFKLQKNNKISFDDIIQYPFSNSKHTYSNIPLYDWGHWKDWYRHCPDSYLSIFNFPFLNNVSISYNIYDVVRNWLLFNIGEVVVAYGRTFNQDLFTFSKALMRNVDLNNVVDLSVEDYENYREFTDMAVFVTHLDLDVE
jgi:Fe-S cluster biosynthesis and repair protein YggX